MTHINQMSHADMAKETAKQEPTVKRIRIIAGCMIYHLDSFMCGEKSYLPYYCLYQVYLDLPLASKVSTCFLLF